MTRIFKFLTSSITAFSAAPRAARVGSFLFFVASVADGTLMPFFPLWARNDAGIPVKYIGLLLGCYAGGELLATPFVGGIADRVGRRPVLLASTTGIGVGFILLFFAPGAITIAFSLLVIGTVGPAIGTWLYAISAALPWGTGIAASITASLALAVAARRHEAGQSSKSENG